MTDTTTMHDAVPLREAIARAIHNAAWGEFPGATYDETYDGAREAALEQADAALAVLSETGWEIVRAAQPDAPEITEAMVEAAARVFFTWNGLIREIPEPNLKTQPVWKIAHAALDAALKARGVK